MPMYEYHCQGCGIFTQLRKIHESDVLTHCPMCGDQSKRIISAPRLSVISTTVRLVHSRNEKSAEEPRRVSRPDVVAEGGKLKRRHPHLHAQHRPWMLSH
jgi:putative FmdB family regulatory protein